ncbi:MAG: hypothetical protein K8R45_06040 [Desulfobacterales bacterium]|nr:hypothetical protein [Desulfobacterales bacterium]
MAANRKKLNIIRVRKAKPNKKNLKVYMKRIQRNTEILRELASSEGK